MVKLDVVSPDSELPAWVTVTTSPKEPLIDNSPARSPGSQAFWSDSKQRATWRHSDLHKFAETGLSFNFITIHFGLRCRYFLFGYFSIGKVLHCKPLAMLTLYMHKIPPTSSSS